MAGQVQGNGKRTYYNILQVSNDADFEAITASYQRLKSKYTTAGDAVSRNELMFVEHAYEALSDANKRNLYDKQLLSTANPSITQYSYDVQANDSWFSSTKLIVVMIGVLAVVAYGLSNRHTEEKEKIKVSKEAVGGNNEASRINAESNYVLSNGAVQVMDKSIDRSAEIASRALDIRRQEAETRKMEVESRIRLNEAAVKQRSQSSKDAEERMERCQYMRSLIDQANRAGAYEEARALQARGC